MPIKLRNPGSHSLEEIMLHGLIINRATVKDMVKGYRTAHQGDPSCLKFIHFNIKEVLQLLIDNQVIDPAKTISSQLNGIDKFGLKVYLANHTSVLTTPAFPGPGVNPYLNKDTAILCNTKLNGTKWVDQLLDTPGSGSSISILGAGEGLDRGSICPPNCPPYDDPDGYQNEDIYP